MIETRPPRRVLVADDDDGVRTVVSWQLEAAGYAVSQAGNGVRALQALLADRHDLVVLDLSLPGLDGLDLLRRIRRGGTAAQADTPVIVLSDPGAPTGRITGFDEGADDHLDKPFSPDVLEARVRAVLRLRNRPTVAETLPATPPDTVRVGQLEVDSAARRVTLRGEPVQLTAKEFDLLVFFASRPGLIFSRGELLARVWHSPTGRQGEATVTEHVHRLRRKIEDDPARPTLLRTVHGAGYRWEPPT